MICSGIQGWVVLLSKWSLVCGMGRIFRLDGASVSRALLLVVVHHVVLAGFFPALAS
jgi:hypothetical protein